MASADPLDWTKARDDYIDPLDRRYPSHRFKEKTEGWRDRIDLRIAERRAANLEKSNLAAFSKPNDEAEALFQHTFEEASAARKISHDRDAAVLWREMEKQLTKEGRADRGWYLVAKGRAEEMEKLIQRRRVTVADLLAKATLPDQIAQTEAAARYRDEKLRDIIDRFEKYPDVADLVAQAKASLPVDEPDAGRPKPEPTPVPGSAPRS